ncbi:MAG TPA: hypothetical protein VKS82_14840 [Streptosporangiaceae bacterium]|nr:hypothetical protein [Streptosporangiaceae bacterium]
MTDGADEEMGMDLQEASAILQETRDRARRALVVRRPVLLAVWGAAWLVSDGAIWLSVRGQRPYNGPTPAALMTLSAAIAAATVFAVIYLGRAGSGVGGLSVLQRRVLLLSYLGGYVALFTLEAAIDHAGASRAVIGVYGAAAPVLLVALIIAASAAVFLNWSLLGLGLWLLAVAAGSGFAGPVTVWAVSALAGGGALLVMAVIGLRRDRS